MQKMNVIQPYQIVIDKVLSGNASGQGDAPVPNDANFIVTEIISTQTGDYTVKMSDQSTGAAFSNSPVRQANFSGTAQQPRQLKHPYLLKRGTKVIMDLVDLSGSSNTIQIVLSGYKVR